MTEKTLKIWFTIAFLTIGGSIGFQVSSHMKAQELQAQLAAQQSQIAAQQSQIEAMEQRLDEQDDKLDAMFEFATATQEFIVITNTFIDQQMELNYLLTGV